MPASSAAGSSSREPAATPARSATCASTRCGCPATAATWAAGRPRWGPTRSPKAISCPESEVVQLGDVLATYAEATPELRRTGLALGQGLATIVNAFNPSLVVLGGYLAPLFSLVQREVQAGLAERALPACLESVTLSLPGLGGDSVLLGAAEIAFEPLFVDPVAALGAALVDVRSRLAG